MFISQQKEQFSRAYVRAVAAAAGYGVAEPQVDDDSIDCTICSRGRLGKIHSPKVDLQLKCTTDQPGTMRLAHRLKIKNFDDLRDTDVLVPRILVVLCVPTDVIRWLEHSEDHLVLRRCAFWVSLRGEPPCASRAREPDVTVHLPCAQRFSVEQLEAMMTRVSAGELP
jgi:hypothetical protein